MELLDGTKIGSWKPLENELNFYLPVHGAMTPAQVSPTTAAKMSAAAMDPPTKNTYLNSDLDRKFCKYLMNATA